jgi:hypothetical protein
LPFIFLSHKLKITQKKIQTSVPIQLSPEQSGIGYVSGIICVSVVSSSAVPSGPAKDA